MKRTTIVATVVVFAVLVGGAVWTMRREPKSPAAITAPVTRGDLEDGVLATGTIEAKKLVSVGAQATGVLTKLYVALGDRVAKGQPIAEIDSSTEQNDLRRAEAGSVSVRAQRAAQVALLTQTRLAAERLRALVAIDAGSRADLETAEATLATTQANIAALDAQLTQAQIAENTARVNVGYTHVVAPIDGTVVAVLNEEGQTLNAAFSVPAIIKLAQLDTMTVKAQISEADVPRVHPGQAVYFTLLGDPDRRYEATLNRVEPGPTTLASDTSTSSTAASATSAGVAKAIYYNGIFDVPNTDRSLRIAMTAQVTIVVAVAKDVVLVPSLALGARQTDGRYKVRVRKAAAIEDRLVRTGLNNRVVAEVKEGLAVGDEVVTGETASPDASK
jgi:membrane fusion protein, macrolide-specific efflux system